MNITIEHAELLKTLELVARVSTKHLTLPILQCVYLEAENNKLIVRGTNLEIGIESILPIKQNEAGSVSVSAMTLLQTVSLINQKEVVLRKEGEMLVVETVNSKSSLNTVSFEDFPHIPKLETDGQIIQGKNFAVGIKTAVFAASQSSIKPELGSVYVFQKKEHTITFVATDSFRLVEKTIPGQQVVLDGGILIPYKNAIEIARVCELFEEDPKLLINENQCALQFKNFYITSRLTTGTFPDYEGIIPKEYVTHTTLLKNDLQNALKKTNIFLNRFLRLTMSVAGNILSLTSKGDEGTTKEEIKVSTEGDDIALNFNQRYIQEIIPHIIDESIVIHFAGIGRPIVMESVHEKSLRYLVMPMNK